MNQPTPFEFVRLLRRVAANRWRLVLAVFLAVALPTLVWAVFLTLHLRGQRHTLPSAGEERTRVPSRVHESPSEFALPGHAEERSLAQGGRRGAAERRAATS